MTITLRSATPADARTIHQFITELADYERALDEVKVTITDLEDQLSQQQPPFRCLIAESCGQPAGFALYFFAYSTWEGASVLYLEDLYVRPQFRSERIGLAFMKELSRHALDYGCARFDWSVLDWNQPAIDFYHALGARPVIGWTRYRMDRQALQNLTSNSAALCQTSQPVRT